MLPSPGSCKHLQHPQPCPPAQCICWPFGCGQNPPASPQAPPCLLHRGHFTPHPADVPWGTVPRDRAPLWAPLWGLSPMNARDPPGSTHSHPVPLPPTRGWGHPIPLPPTWGCGRLLPPKRPPKEVSLRLWKAKKQKVRGALSALAFTAPVWRQPKAKPVSPWQLGARLHPSAPLSSAQF